MQLSQITIAGYAGRDAEMKTSQAGLPITNVSLGVTNQNKDKEKETTWYRITFFGKAAERAQEIKKGENIFVMGRHKEEKYKTREGEERSQNSVIADTFQKIPKGEAFAEKPYSPPRQQYSSVEDDLNIPF